MKESELTEKAESQTRNNGYVDCWKYFKWFFKMEEIHPELSEILHDYQKSLLSQLLFSPSTSSFCWKSSNPILAMDNWYIVLVTTHQLPISNNKYFEMQRSPISAPAWQAGGHWSWNASLCSICVLRRCFFLYYSSQNRKCEGIGKKSKKSFKDITRKALKKRRKR